jgi:molybdenum cofactor cytidylyltransferase
MTNIPHLLLAAGTSKRMGEPKQLLKWGSKSLIQHQVELILECTEKLYVVLGAYSAQIKPLLNTYSIEIIEFENWQRGMGASLAYGIQNIQLKEPIVDGVLVSLIDQPLVPSSHYKKMRATFQKDKNQIIASESDQRWQGVPVLFDASYMDQLADFRGEEGAKMLLKKYLKNIVTVKAGNTLIDMDTPEVYQKLVSNFSPLS